MALAKLALTITVLGGVVADATSNNIASLAPLLLSGGLVGGVVALMTTRSKNRESHASADVNLAEAAGDWQTIYRQSIDDLNAKVNDLTRELSRVRDDLRETKASQLKAERELVQAKLDYAELDARSGKERHDLRDDLAALAVENANLKTDLATANERIATLEARAGMIERRASDRRDDAAEAAQSRLAVLEDRADRSETRADAAGERADEAGRNAEAQEHRNDDTPGHA